MATFGGSAGTLTIDSPSQNIGSLVVANGSINVGTTTGNPLFLTSGGSVSGFGGSIAAPLVIEPASGSANGSYTLTTTQSMNLFLTGAIRGGPTAGAITLYVSPPSNGGLFGTVVISNVTNGAAASVGVTSSGGNLTLGGAIGVAELKGGSYTGPTTVNSGELWLVGPISSSSTLVGGGGTFLLGNTGGAQNVNGLALNCGISTVNVQPTFTLNLGNITRSPGAMVNFSTAATNGTVTTTGSGFIGPWAIYGIPGSLSYAVANGPTSSISPYTGATVASSGTWANMTSPTTNYVYQMSESKTVTLVGNVTGNTLQTNMPGPMTVSTAGNSLTLNGILAGAQGSVAISGTGSVQIGAANELDLCAFNSGSISLSSTVGGVGSIVFAAPSGTSGSFSLLGNNTYAGGTYLDSGTLTIAAAGTSSSNSAIGTGPLTLNNGTVITSNSSSPMTLATNNPQVWNGSFSIAGSGILSLGNGPITINTNALTVTNSSSVSQTEAGDISGTGNLTLGGINLSGSVNFSGTLAGGGAVSGPIGPNVTGVISSGLVLSGSNSYSGGTTITTGSSLQVGAGGTSGNLPGVGLTNNGALSYNLSSNYTENNLINGGGSVKQIGTGILTLPLVEPYTGATQITHGTLALTSASSIAASSGLADAGVFDISSAGNQTVQTLTGTGAVNLGANYLTVPLTGASNTAFTYSGSISGSGGLVEGTSAGAGNSLVLTGSNSYSGGTTINSSGTLQIGNQNTTGSIAGDVTDNGVLIFDRSDTITFNGQILGNGAFNQIGNGDLILTANNSGISNVGILNGMLSVSADNNLGPDTTTLHFGSGTFETTASFTNGHPIALGNSFQYFVDSGVVTTQSGAITGNLGSFSLLKVGPGTLILTGSNSYTGNFGVNAGTLQISGAGTLGAATAAVTLSGGILDLGGTTQTLGTFTFAGGTLQNGTLNAGKYVVSAPQTINSGLSGAGSLTVNSSLIVTGTLAYTGGTTISQSAVLQVGNGGTSGALGTGGIKGITSAELTYDRSDTYTESNLLSGSLFVTQEGAGTLVLSGTNTFNGEVQVSSGAVEATNSSSLGTGLVYVASGAALLLDGSSTNPLTPSSAFTLNGSGLSSGGALENVAGINTISGAIVLHTSASLGTDAGSTILLSGNSVTGSTGLGPFVLTLTGAGTGVLADNIASSVTGLIKSGIGTWTLSNSNTYTGTTSVTGGTLLAANPTGSATSSGAISVSGGGTIGGNGTVGAISLSPGGNVLAGTTTNIGTLTATSLTWNGLAQFEALLSNSSNSSSMLKLGTGALTKGTGSIFAFNFLGTGKVGQTYTLATFGASNTNFQATDFFATNLPSGLTGVFSLVTSGATESVQVTLEQVPSFTSGPPATSIPVNVSYTFNYTATGSPAPTFSVVAGALPTGLTLSTSGTISGTPTTPGTYTGTVQASNGSGIPVSQAFSIAVTNTYSNWATQAGLSGPSAAQTAILEPDGVANLLKYAIGLNPLTNYNPGDAGLPSVSIQNVSGSNYLALTFNGTASDVTYQVQATSDLSAGWTTIQTFHSGGTSPRPVTVRDNQTVTASPQRYMRLMVTAPLARLSSWRKLD